MATCGTATRVRGACSKGTRLLIAIWCISTATLISGCATPGKSGTPPAISDLRHLPPLASTKAEVLLAVGEPSGYGVARVSPATQPREVWFYEYAGDSGDRVDRQVLLIFFDKEQYDGYLTFSSTVTMKKI